MKHKKRGRKIYTYQARNRRVFSDYHPLRSAVGTVLMLAVIGVLGFVGYNVIGPIVTRVHQEELTPTATAEPYFTEEPQQGTAPAVPDPTVTTAQTESEAAVTTLTTETEPAHTRYAAGLDVAFMAPEDALKNLDAVEAAAKSCRETGYTSLILPLKLSSGILQYASSVDKAVACGASDDSKLTLREIVNAAKRYDIQCIAQISTLEDHTFPNYFKEGSYLFKDGTTRWLDNKPDEGGKAWLNPFDAASGDYLAGIAAEIQKSGFTQIICTGAVFPHFYHSDAELLGNQIEDPVRRAEALMSVLNRISDVAPTAGLYADLFGISQNAEEAFQPASLHMASVYINIDPNDFDESYSVADQRFDPVALAFPEKIKMLAESARIAAGSHTVIPCLNVSSLSQQQIDNAVGILAGDGFKTICLHTQQAPAEDDTETETESGTETETEPET